MTELDEVLLEVIRPRVQEGLKFLVLLTKSDKLNRQEANKALSIARLQAGGGEVKLFSALKKQGVGEVAQLLWQWTHDEDGSAWQTPGLGASGHPDDFDEPESLDDDPRAP